LAAGLADRLPEEVVVAPTLPYGASGEHQAFPGTLSIGQAAMELVVLELVRSATETFPRVLLISAHGGNRASVTSAVRRLRGEERDVRAWTPAAVWRGDAHAGRTETSVMLALGSDHVQLEYSAAGNVAPLGDLLPGLVSAGVRAVSPNGVLGDPSGASEQEGHGLLEAAVDDLVRAVEAWGVDDREWL
jgi:creatinine amidohydrolase